MKTIHYPRFGTMPVPAILGTVVLSIVVATLVLFEGKRTGGQTATNSAAQVHAPRETVSATPDTIRAIVLINAETQRNLRLTLSATPSVMQERNNKFTLSAGSDPQILLSYVPRRVRFAEDPFLIGYTSETAALEDKQRRADTALASLLQRVNGIDPSGALAEILMVDLHRVHRNIVAAAASGSESRLADAVDLADPAYFTLNNERSSTNR